MKKKIMILGATYTQVPLVKKAKDLGYYTIVSGIKGDYPANKYADSLCNVDISNPEEVYKAAIENNIDGIVTCCMDLPIRALGYTCDKLNLCGLSESAAVLSNQKYLMKEKLVKAHVNTPKFKKVDSMEALENAYNELNNPVVVKALDLQASRGVFVCKNIEQAKMAYESIKSLSTENYCIVEEFIEGRDIGAQAFVYRGEVLFVMPHGDEVYMGAANKPVGHYAPIDAEEIINKKITNISIEGIKAIGLDNCAVNIDMILTENNEVYMIELTGRAGATCLPEIVDSYYGVDYYSMIIEMAMGKDPKLIWNARRKYCIPSAARFITSKKSGRLMSVNIPPKSENIVFLKFYKEIGEYISAFNDGKDRIGEVLVKGNSLEYCFQELDNVIDNLEYVIKEDEV